MKEEFQQILLEYKDAYNEQYTGHPLANLIRQEIPQRLFKTIGDEKRYLIKGSAGAGNWTTIPWIAIFDILITTTAQSGYYPVFLFREDMSGLYLSLNQGVTEIKEKYKKDAKQVLKIKAEDYRAQLGNIPANFSELVINLKDKDSRSNLASLYEAGNIFAKFYDSKNLPTEELIIKDIFEILKIYELLSYNEITPPANVESEYEESKFIGYENLQKFRFHKRIERNNQLSKKVKLIQGYTCKACGINFEEVYGEIGKFFIEAHHLTPISNLVGNKVLLDVRKDFTVLCSNCHSMIHKLDDPSNLDLLISILRHNGL
jgi:5-methylcytosine-specific restriction protein A